MADKTKSLKVSIPSPPSIPSCPPSPLPIPSVPFWKIYGKPTHYKSIHEMEKIYVADCVTIPSAEMALRHTMTLYLARKHKWSYKTLYKPNSFFSEYWLERKHCEKTGRNSSQKAHFICFHKF